VLNLARLICVLFVARGWLSSTAVGVCGWCIVFIVVNHLIQTFQVILSSLSE